MVEGKTTSCSQTRTKETEAHRQDLSKSEFSTLEASSKKHSVFKSPKFWDLGGVLAAVLSVIYVFCFSLRTVMPCHAASVP